MQPTGIFQEYKIFSYGNGTGRIIRTYPVGVKRNLKKGRRKELNRDTLTIHAKKKIRAAGMMLQHYTSCTPSEKSANMYTLTYGKDAPDDKTAKKHLRQLCKRMQRLGKWKYFVWVAQQQTGERAAAQGKQSYRAKNGSAIHFHLLTTYTDTDLIRKHWREIVYKWQKKAGHQHQDIGGVHGTPIYDSGRYITRYLKNDGGKIKGNNWGMSTQLRKLSAVQKEIVYFDQVDYEYYCRNTKSQKIVERNKFKINILEYNNKVYFCEDWAGASMVYSEKIAEIKAEIEKRYRNRKRINKLIYNKELILQLK